MDEKKARTFQFNADGKIHFVPNERAVTMCNRKIPEDRMIKIRETDVPESEWKTVTECQNCLSMM